MSGFDLNKQQTALKQTILSLPKIVGDLAVNFSKERFRAGGWYDRTFMPWKERKGNKHQGRALLVQSGRLRRSIRVVRMDQSSVTIGSDVPYARIHNEGYKGEITQHVKAHSRHHTTFGVSSKKALKTRTKIEFGRVRTGATSEVKAYSRKLQMDMPQRQFMGQSDHLTRIIGRKITTEILKALK